VTDAVIIGAGANERVAARILARAGRKVVLIEEHPAPDEDTGWISPKMGLKFKVHRSDPWARAPLDGGEHLELWQDMARSVEAIKRVSPRDAGRWPEFCCAGSAGRGWRTSCACCRCRSPSCSTTGSSTMR
jgi:phytoene dehydrogenase-like protein